MRLGGKGIGEEEERGLKGIGTEQMRERKLTLEN